MRRRSKYGALPTMVDGIKFASKKEAKRYGELKLLLKAGRIRALKLQPAFDLSVVPLPSSALRSPKPVHVGRYLGDFSYDERIETPAPNSDWWQPVVEDVKGIKTPIYRLKKRMVEAMYQIQIRET